MSFSDKGGGEDAISMDSGNIENNNLDSTLTSFSSNDMENLNELTLDNADIETDDHEIVVESQDIIEHEEEVEMEEEEVITDHLEVIIDQSSKPEEQISVKPIKTTVVPPPLRPLTIAPKPTKVQPVLLLQGTGTGQAIKLVSQQGQELNLANIITRPVTLKPTFKTISTQGGNISLVQQKPLLMKKVLTSPKTVSKPLTTVQKQPQQHFMVVQKADQQQLKLLQAQGNVVGTPTKTLTLQQAQEMGLIANTKLNTTAQSSSKQTVLLSKNQPKTIKFVPQVSSPQIIAAAGVNTKTITLNQIKGPTKILPVGSISGTKTAQRIIFKSATGTNQILPQGQILQLGGSQNLNSGQLHQINIPGRGMQYIKFVTASSLDTNTITTTTDSAVKSTSSVTPTNIVLSEVKPISMLNRIVPKDKVPISPKSNKPITSTTSLMIIPPHIPTTQLPKISKVAIPPPPKPSPTLKPLVIGNANENVFKEEVNPNGMRPRKPCNCNKSQCLKLYCDCFANGEFCFMCNCVNCYNNLENEDHRNRAIKACLERNPHAFRPKIGKAKDVAGDISIRKHTKGCNCKRSGCLKNYCECYENNTLCHHPRIPSYIKKDVPYPVTGIAKIACSNNCKCVGCRNIEDSMEKKNISEKSTNTPAFAENNNVNNKNYPPLRHRRSSSTRKQTINFITDDVIEATCQCLLTISDNADENMHDEEMTKRLIIEEFGRCLTEIIDCSSSRNSS